MSMCVATYCQSRIYTAVSDEHLQKKEKTKLMRESKNDNITREWIDGDRAIGELIQKLGQLAPFMMHSIFVTLPKSLIFRANCLNTAEMYRRITTASCPSGIHLQAAADWKRGKKPVFSADLTRPPFHRST